MLLPWTLLSAEPDRITPPLCRAVLTGSAPLLTGDWGQKNFSEVWVQLHDMGGCIHRREVYTALRTRQSYDRLVMCHDKSSQNASCWWQKMCAGRESNPGLNNGNVAFYH